jgi:prepilin signal peptidase PulO-like enzyme (type II secretory pathway)
MSTLGKVATVVVLLFGVWFAIVGIVMDEARFDWVRIGAVALIGFGIVIAMLDRKSNRN